MRKVLIKHPNKQLTKYWEEHAGSQGTQRPGNGEYQEEPARSQSSRGAYILDW